MNTAVLWEAGLDVAAVGILVAANGFFVASEFALVTVRKTRVDQLIAEGNRFAPALRRALDQPDRYLAAAQLGITMASLGLGWVGEPALAALFQPFFQGLPVPLSAVTAHSVAFVLAFAIITSLHIVIGEQMPKIVALQYADRMALSTVTLTEFFMKAFWPFISILNGTTRRLLRMSGLREFSGHSMVHSEDELKMLVTASQEAGVIGEQEHEMLHRVFEFGNLSAGSVMVPRTEVVALCAEWDAGAVIERVTKAAHNVLPVYRASLDEIVGTVQVRDLFGPLTTAPETFLLLDHVHEVETVPATMPADQLLAQMLHNMTHLVIVIDEYGGTAGLVTFEGLMERIVGGAGGAADLKTLRMTALPDGSAMLDGLMLVTDLNARFALHVDEHVYNTVGGYVWGRLGRRPRVGDRIDVEDRVLQVEALDGLRVAWVHLALRQDAEPAGGPGATTQPTV